MYAPRQIPSRFLFLFLSILLTRARTRTHSHTQDDLRLSVQPSVLKNGTLREYQLEGLNWMVRLYNNGISGILADEMGLGKTVQTVAMIGYLTEYKDAPGPHMVLAPKSTMSNWQKEFKKWLPDHRCIYIGGTKEEREEQLSSVCVCVCARARVCACVCVCMFACTCANVVLHDTCNYAKQYAHMHTPLTRTIRASYPAISGR